MDKILCLFKAFSIHLHHSVRIADVPGVVSVNVADVCELQIEGESSGSSFCFVP